jgi:hypothetical protein
LPEFDKNEVRHFLRTFKEIAASRGIHIINREKTDNTLIRLGLTRTNCKEEIMNLSVLNYSSGPDPDFSQPGRAPLWIFGKEVKGHEIYIKLKVVEGVSVDSALCISFHISEESLTYPFKI